MKKNKNIIHNIDKTHSEYINEFETNENEIIPSLIKKRDILKSNIKKLKNSQIDEVMNLKYNVLDYYKSILSLDKIDLVENPQKIIIVKS